MRTLLQNRTRDRHRRLWALIFEHKGRLFLAMLCMLVIAGATSATAFLVKPVLDDIFIKKDATMLRLLPFAVVVVFLLRGLSMYGQEYLMNYVGEGIIRRLRNQLFDAIQDLPLAFYHKEKTGGLMSRITYDVNIVKTMVSTAVTSTLKDAFSIVGLTAVIFYRDWKMAAFAFIVLPVAFYPVIEFGRRVRRVSTGYQEAMGDLSSYLHETFAGAKIVKAFGMEGYEKKRFHDKTRGLFFLEMKAVVARSLSSPIMEFLGGVGIAFVIWYGGFKVLSGASTAGTFFSFTAAVLMLYDPVKKLSHLNNAVQQGMAAADRIFDVMEKVSEISDPAVPVPLTRGPHRISFDNVSFGYSEDLVLQDIRLEAVQGEVIALVGMSGGGKTSLVNLIPRFYDVTGGAIRIDGVDIRDLRVAELRGEIAIVTQEPILFNDTVRSNIAYGNPEASEDDIIAAAKAAYAYDYITGFPKGFDTVIGELGGRLSGGEKQRLCIARALLKDAPILILDEATSSLDTEAEAIVQKAMDNLMAGRTTFVIAHRLSTVAKADRIIVVVGGRVVEEGRHDELMACSGEYCKLYHMQFGNGVPAQPGPAGEPSS
ncbi:MAG: ABC transporter ATP-binding protein [Pseudomonadota bacterium]